jgi:hypothetical protein
LFGRLDALSGNSFDAEAFLEPAHPRFSDSNIVDTVDNRMALLESNNHLESTTNQIDCWSIWLKAIGAFEPDEKGGLWQEKGVEEWKSEFLLLLLLAASLRRLFCSCFQYSELDSQSNHDQGKRHIEDMCTSLFLDQLDIFDFALLEQQNTHSEIQCHCLHQ